MSFKSFVSRSVITENEEKAIEGQSAGQTGGSSGAAQAEYDPRTLYERLQEQKQIKDDEFKEKTKFSNLVKRIDEEDAEYYQALSETQQKLDDERRLKDQLELEQFRRAVEDTHTPLTSKNHAATNTTAATANHTTAPRKLSNPPKKDPASKKLSGLVLVKKKRDRDDDNDDKKDDRGSKDGHEKATHDTKKQKTRDSATAAAAPAAKGGLGSLLADYGDSDSNSDSD
ncbi:N-terminal domain of NEFA-interacting nuclear protein NIP30-domain-containing protein [Gongronella butleri]|nr:N-terminal domain of NEFA-interacting nuclear protein NIP30-domain-containing protein [Gongronella butleri]